MSGILTWGVDARLVHSTLAGNKDAFGRLVERHLPTVEAVAFAYTRNRTDAEDVSQEAFLRAYQSLDTLRERAKFGSWVATIARNAGLRMASRGSREVPLTDARAASLSEAAPDFEKNELLQLLHAHVLNLPEDTREVLLLHYYAGKSLREIGTTLTISREAAAKRLQRGRESLTREILASLDGASFKKQDSTKRAHKIALAVLATPAAWKAAAVSGTVGVFAEMSVTKLVALAILGASAGGIVYIAVKYRPDKPGTVAVRTETHDTAPRQDRPTEKLPRTSKSTPAIEKMETTGIGAIGVTVKQSDGRPAANAKVRIEMITWDRFAIPPDETLAKETRTDANGVAQFSELPLGPYGVICQFIAGMWADDVVLNKDAPSAQVSMALQPGVPFKGSVVNVEGLPVPNAIVYLYEVPLVGSISWNILAASRVKADAAGAFNGGLTLPVPQRFCVVSNGHAKTITELIQPGSGTMQLVAQDGMPMRGTVVDAESQQPLSEIVLVVQGGPANVYLEVESDGSGEFEVNDLLPGSYRIEVEEPGYTTEEPVNAQVQSASDSPNVLVPVRLGGTIAGRVLDGDTGEPIAGAKVSAWSSDGRNNGRSSEPTDSSGAYAIFGLASGSYHINPYVDDSAYVSKEDLRTVSVTVGQEIEDVNFELVRGALVRGRVVEADGTGSTFALLHITRPDGSRMTDSRTENKDGRFELRFLGNEPSVRIKAFGQSGASEEIAAQPRVDNPSEVVVPITIPRDASIEGLVVDKDDRPLPNSYVAVLMESDDSVTSATGKELISDENGKFHATGLHPDVYYVGGINARGGATPQGERVDLTKGGAATGIVVHEEAAGGFGIAGRIVDDSGRPLAGATVQADFSQTAVANSGADGSFQIANVREITHALYITHALFASERLSEVAGGTTGLVVKLQRRGTVPGRVIDAATGKPITAFELLHARGKIVEREDGREEIEYNGDLGIREWFKPYGDADGRFILSSAESGETVLVVRADKYAAVLQEVNVPPGGASPDVTVRLGPAGRITVTVIDQSNVPVSGANVQYTPNSSWYNGGFKNTDSQGQVVIDNMPTTPVRIFVGKENLVAEPVEVEPSTGEGTTVTIRIGLAESGK